MDRRRGASSQPLLRVIPGRMRAILLGLGLVGIVLSGALSAGSLTTAHLNRGSAVDSVSDENGIVGIDVSSSVSSNGRDRLVDITNNYDENGFQVTVSLHDGSDGTLYIGGSSGDTVTVSLNSGQTRGVDIEVQGNPGVITFDITAQIDGISISAPGRESEVESYGGTPGGPS